MERVAARAGVSKALGYAYFNNSDELLAALFDREMTSYDRAIAAALEGADTFEQKMRAVVVAMFDMVAERGRLFGTLLHGQSASASSLEGRRTGRKRVSEEFIAGLVEDEYDIPHEQALSVASIWIAATGGAIDSWVACRGNRRQLTDLFVALSLGGLQRVASSR
jgi:AcrR family transcriptional regulator